MPRRLFWVLLFAVSPLVPLSAQALRVPYDSFTLANGLQVLVAPDHAVPVVTVNIWYHVGSGDEKPGRTGFAHLFEHIMFMGSEHVPTGEFDKLLEAAGGDNNGSTTEDRTNYFEDAPSNALPLMLWLDSDRQGFLLPEIDSAKVDLQRGVVQNERRQSYENQPYGLAEENILQRLYPSEHPYHWPVIGSMADLSAATIEDVRNFFRSYYTPNNSTMVIGGDVDTAATSFPDMKFVVTHIGLPRLDDFCWVATQDKNIYAGMAVNAASRVSARHQSRGDDRRPRAGAARVQCVAHGAGLRAR